MKKFLFISFSSLLCALWAQSGFAGKKYRYIKREHGVKFQLNAPLQILPAPFKGAIDLTGAYAYNWKGFFEFGPYFAFGMGLEEASDIPMTYSGGLLAEYNFIKNRGKRKLIPSAGISLGVKKGDTTNPLHYAGGAHVSLKIFVGKRTPFTITLPYKVVLADFSFAPDSSMTHHLEPSMGFSYYFDFY